MKALRFVLSVTFGAALGGVLRYVLEQAWPPGDMAFPFATFGANVVGSFLIGLAAFRRDPEPGIDPFQILRHGVTVGFCGGLTTFSTLSLELFHQFDHGRVAAALLYVFATLTAGLAAVWLGSRVRHPWRGTRDVPPPEKKSCQNDLSV